MGENKNKKYRKDLSGVIDYSRGLLLKYVEIFFILRGEHVVCKTKEQNLIKIQVNSDINVCRSGQSEELCIEAILKRCFFSSEF